MNIGIIGAGKVGTGIGKRLAAKGHSIVVSFAKTDEDLANAKMTIGGNAKSGSVEDAARHGDVVILATPWDVTLQTVGKAAGALADKIIWDCTNPFKPTYDELSIGTTTSAGEEIAKAAPQAKVVKAIPPFAQLLHSQSTLIGGQRPGVFVCGNDEKARAVVASLLNDIEAMPVDTGPLKLARFTEPLGMLVTNLAYVKGLGYRTMASIITEKS